MHVSEVLSGSVASTVIVRKAVSWDFVQFDSDCDTPSIHTLSSYGVFNYCVA